LQAKQQPPRSISEVGEGTIVEEVKVFLYLWIKTRQNFIRNGIFTCGYFYLKFVVVLRILISWICTSVSQFSVMDMGILKQQTSLPDFDIHNAKIRLSDFGIRNAKIRLSNADIRDQLSSNETPETSSNDYLPH